MTDTEKLYETLGELLYVVAMADGVIQDDEREALKKMLENHSWAKEISWSFNYEESKNSSIESLYEKVISVCSKIGPSPIYEEFIESINVLANADQNLDSKEEKVISSFSKDLVEQFSKDISALKSKWGMS